jgi:hypothetical protein
MLFARTHDAFAPSSASAAAGGGGGDGGAAAAAAAAAAAQESQWLFAATESQTIAFNVTDGSKNILDQAGVPSGACAAVRGPLLVVARDDALYDYTADTRAGCTVFDGRGGGAVLCMWLFLCGSGGRSTRSVLRGRGVATPGQAAGSGRARLGRT